MTDTATIAEPYPPDDRMSDDSTTNAPSASSRRSSDREALRAALAGTPRFVYANGLRLVGMSVVWVLCSLPVVTIGPATLGAYVAILGLRSDENRIDRGRVRQRLRESGGAAALLAGIPQVLGVVVVSYVSLLGTAPSLLAEVLLLAALYAGAYAVLVLVPTFVFLAEGDDDLTALKRGVAWVGSHPTLALVTGLVTLGLLGVTVALMVAFVLLFPALAFGFQVSVVQASRQG